MQTSTISTEKRLSGLPISGGIVVIHGRFLPNKVLALAEPDDAGAGQIRLLEGKTTVAGKATVYVCESFTCKQPVNNPADLEKTLSEVR